MENTTKITKKMRYEGLIDILKNIDADVEYIEFCENEIALLDKKAVKAKEAAAKKKAESDELMDAVEAVLSATEFESIATITSRIDGDEVTAAKVTYRLTQLVKNGVAEKQEISVAGGEGTKARKLNGYRAIR